MAGISGLGDWFKKRLDEAGADINLFDGGRSQGNMNVAPAPSVAHQFTHNPVTDFAGNMFQQGIVAPVQRSANTVAAGAANVMGLGNVGYQSIFGNDQSYQNALDSTAGASNDLLQHGWGNKGGYLTPQQAASSGGGWQGARENFVKPVARGVAEVAPLVVPAGATARGASLGVKVMSGAVQNAAVGGGSNAAAQWADNGHVNLADTAKAAALSGAVGGAFPVAGAGIKVAAKGAKAGADKVAAATAPRYNGLTESQIVMDPRILDVLHNAKQDLATNHANVPLAQKVITGLHEIKNTYGHDFIGGSTADRMQRINQFLEQNGEAIPQFQDELLKRAAKRDIHAKAVESGQGGYIKLPGDDTPKSPYPNQRTAQHLADQHAANAEKLKAEIAQAKASGADPQHLAGLQQNLAWERAAHKETLAYTDPKFYQPKENLAAIAQADPNSRVQGAEQTAFENAHNAGDASAEAKAAAALNDPALRGEMMTPDAKAELMAKFRAQAASKQTTDAAAPQTTATPQPSDNIQLQPSTQTPDMASGSLPKSTGVRVEKPGSEPQTAPSQIRNRGFIDTIFNDPNTATEVKQALVDLDTSYQTRNTNDLQIKAANLVQSHPDIAQQLANHAHDDISVAVGSELIKAQQHAGNFEAAIDTANVLAKNLTEAGRTVQAASIYGKLTPEGILRFAQNEINKYNKATGKSIKLDPTAAEKLVKMSEDIQKMPEGYDRAVATAKLVAEIQHQMPATLAEKLGTLQTMAQLLNLKTNVRNVAGNGMFGGLENVSQTVGAGVDKIFSLFNGGKRTTALPNIGVQMKGFAAGGKQGIKEAAQGINTGPTTQFDLNSVPVFRGKILGTLEKTMNGTLRGGDRAAYTAAFDDTIHGLQKLQKTDQVTPEMMEQAHHTAMYRTFQDSNAVSNFFVGMKKALNTFGIGVEGKRFGLGDIVLKYPKTPGNLLARGIDYSPAGFIKSVFEASKPLFGREFDQKAFVDSFSRAVVGSGSAFGIGYAMSKAGIITEGPEQNKDLRNVQKTAGLGGYQINASGFKRWIASGFNEDAAKLRPGDTLVSYDWAQPIAIPISAGAALGSTKPQKAGQEAGNSIINSANTLAEQPLLQGVQRLFGGYGGLSDAVTNTATSAPASFIPTLLSQVNQLGDNSVRVTSDANPAQEAVNLVKAKVPGAAQTLPKSYDVLGNEKERYQNGSNTPFNVLANPAFQSTYKPSAAADEVLGLYNRTGETKQTPNTAPNSVKISSGKVQLTGQKQADYQKFTGEQTVNTINQLLQDPGYMALPDSEKVKILSAKQTDINNAAKINILGDQPDSVTSGTAQVLAGGGDLKGQVSDVQAKVALEKFKTSNEKTMTIGDTYYFKKRDGSVSQMPKVEYDYNQADSALNLGMDRAQASDDIQSWMKLAEQKYNALESKKSLYDPGTEADKINAITLAQENLMSKVQQYNEYGGFKKGSRGASLPSINVGVSSDLTGPVVSNAAYKAPGVTLKSKRGVRVARGKSTVKIGAAKKI